MAVIEFVAPLLILIYCYGRIVWVLTRGIDLPLNKNKNNHSLSTTASDKFQIARKNTTKKKKKKTFLLISICFVVCWSCNQIYCLMYNFSYNVNWNVFLNKFGVIMAFSNCTINPFVYLAKYQDYQRALMDLFSCKRPQDNEESYNKRSTVYTSNTTINSGT